MKAIAPLVSTVPNIEKMGGADPPGATSAHKPVYDLVAPTGREGDFSFRIADRGIIGY